MTHIIQGGCIALALLLGGCGALLKTPYTPPETSVPPQWQYGTGDSPAVNGKWWHDFNDPTLNQLVDEALRRNNDLAAAAIAVRRAQLQAGLAADKLIPAIAGTTNSTHNRNLSGERVTTRIHSVNASVSYEVDLWGKPTGQTDVAQWEARATAEDLESAALSLIATTMTLYWQNAHLNQRIASSEQNIAYIQKTLELARVRRDAGAVSSLDVLQAEQTLASQQASRTQLLQQRVETRNAMAILFNAPPETAYPEQLQLPVGTLPSVEIGLPMQLVGRRPDLRAAELRLRESLAGLDVSRANYYPALTLTGSLGSSSAALLNVLSNPVAALGIGVTLPFLQWNQVQLTIKVSQADYEKAVVNFRQTLYKALSDVENALSARIQYASEERNLEKSLQSAIGVERIYEIQYRAGAAPLKLWLDAQQTRREAESLLAANRLNRLTNHVTLYKSLGGDATVAALAKSP